MAFPTNPSNNDIHKETGTNRTFVYDSALGVWDQVKEAQADISNIQGHIGRGVTGYTGIKEIDSWRLTTDFTGDAAPLQTNLARADSIGQLTLPMGQGMTLISGQWIFPSTGYWMCWFHQDWALSGTAVNYIKHTWYFYDGSSWRAIGDSHHGKDSGFTYGQVDSSIIIDISNAGTEKIKLELHTANSSVSTRGTPDSDKTWFRFIRLGDTGNE